ncbi:MAG TPA: DNA-binding domain-containing protein [Steroidobacteraceae bacterium]|nr:DNA-binding domain-containing protein [Steroidobacteraceae bacterium]
MPSLAEYQQAMHAYLLAAQEAPEPVAGWCAGDTPASAARLAIYRNTCSAVLVNALRLNYPAVRHVLGGEFFDAQAAHFARREPPASAYLNDYGERFAPFVAALPATASLSYLADLARLEWAVSRALHAPDLPALDIQRLQALDPEQLAQVSFRAHPAVHVLALQGPVERIWQAVLARDEAAMRCIDLSAGSGWVLVERDPAHAVQIVRLPDAIGRLSKQLFAGVPLHVVFESAGDGLRALQDAQAALAGHLAGARLVDFALTTPPREGPAP